MIAHFMRLVASAELYQNRNGDMGFTCPGLKYNDDIRVRSERMEHVR
jgi:hypothetical protein